MIRCPQLVYAGLACFRPTSLSTLVSVSLYSGYLGWTSAQYIDTLGTTCYAHFGIALATLGAWVGAATGRVARWPSAALTPGYIPALGTIAVVIAGVGLGLNLAAAWIGGLDPWPLASVGMLVLSIWLVVGYGRPVLALCLFLGMGVAAALVGPALGPDALTLPDSISRPAWTAAAVLATACVLTRFVFMLRTPHSAKRWPTGPGLPLAVTAGRLLPPRLWEPSIHKVAVVFGVLAAGCSLAQRVFALEWRDATWFFLIGSVCAHLGATGASMSLPRGPLRGASWLMLVGAAGTRAAAGRRMVRKIVEDSFFAAGVFAAVTIALGPNLRLVEMVLVALAACHVYISLASRSRWLLSSRFSGAVAVPAVVAVSIAGWSIGPWGLPTALAACALTGVVAVYVGGYAIGRLDLDVSSALEGSD